MEVVLANSRCVAIVDDSDFDAVSNRSWRLSPKGYVVSGTIFLHRFLVGIPTKSTINVHHKDGNRLNNRRSNLCRTSGKNHSRITVKESLDTMREWAKENGIKRHDSLLFGELRKIKDDIENLRAKRIRLGN